MLRPRRPTRRPAVLVFGTADGGLIVGSTFSRTWVPVRSGVGLPPRWGFHGLRHYYATFLIHAVASVKTVQLALGYSTPTIRSTSTCTSGRMCWTGLVRWSTR